MGGLHCSCVQSILFKDSFSCDCDQYDLGKGGGVLDFGLEMNRHGNRYTVTKINNTVVR